MWLVVATYVSTGKSRTGLGVVFFYWMQLYKDTNHISEILTKDPWNWLLTMCRDGYCELRLSDASIVAFGGGVKTFSYVHHITYASSEACKQKFCWRLNNRQCASFKFEIQ